MREGSSQPDPFFQEDVMVSIPNYFELKQTPKGDRICKMDVNREHAREIVIKAVERGILVRFYPLATPPGGCGEWFRVETEFNVFDLLYPCK
jgi:hypothetical protein